MSEKKHKRGEVVLDNIVKEIECEESFCPRKVVSKYLFDNTYVVRFELEEPSTSILNAPTT